MNMKRLLMTSFVLILIVLISYSQSPSTFKHPGIMVTQAQLDFIKAQVQANSASPLVAGYNKLASESKGSTDYTANPYQDVEVIASGIGPAEAAFRNDAHAMYIHAMKWAITGNTANRDKAIQIGDAWAVKFRTLYSNDGHPQQPTLEGSWACPIWCAAGEILKYANNGSSGWNSTNFNSFINRILDYVNGSIASADNWYVSKYLSLMSAGVFLNNSSIYNQGYNGIAGRIDAIGTDGKMLELDQDFVHSQYNLIGLTQAAEIAFNQDDSGLFTRSNNRLKVGAEAYVKNLMGTGVKDWISTSSWARHSSPYEALLARYTGLGQSMPNVQNYVVNYGNRVEDGCEDHFIGWMTCTHGQIGTVAPPVTGNLAADKPVTASSEPQPENPASAAVDNNTDTRWSASVYPQWIEVDLGSVQSIGKTELVCYGDRAYQFKVEVKTSSTGSYTQVVYRTANTTAGTVTSPITDNFGSIDARFVKLTVTGCSGYTGTWASISEFRVFAGSSSTFTTTIQAENYTQMQGVELETTSDTGGGQDVGHIDPTDWMIYPAVNIPVAGTYTIEYRVASLNGGGTLRFEEAGGATQYASLTIPNTGGWQNWTTIKHTVDLTSGSHSFGINAVAGGWNFNWLTITQGLKSAKINAMSSSSKADITIWPNPSSDRIFIKGLSDLVNELEIIDIHGKTVVKARQVNLNEGFAISNLPIGTYFAKVVSGEIVSILKFMKK
jgi:hypothetical protein